MVIVDSGLKGGAGVDLAEEIAAMPELSSGRIVILGSGDAYDPARHAGLVSQLVCSNPSTSKNSTTRSSAAMGRAVEESVAVPARTSILKSPVGAERWLRILVAEDNDFNRELLEQILQTPRPFRCHGARRPKALSMLSRKAFDLMLVDIHMPELDGLEVVPPGAAGGTKRRSSGSSACDRPDRHVEARRPRPLPRGWNG